MLDLRLTHALARLVGALLPALSAGDSQAAAVMTMALEVATVLANPSVCLDPQQPASKRASHECPPVSEVGPVPSALTVGGAPRSMHAFEQSRLMTLGSERLSAALSASPPGTRHAQAGCQTRYINGTVSQHPARHAARPQLVRP